MYLALTALKAASLDRLVPEAIRSQLDTIIARVNADLQHAGELLSRVNQDKISGKLRYTLWKGKGSKFQLDQHLKQLKGSCNELKDLCKRLRRPFS